MEIANYEFNNLEDGETGTDFVTVEFFGDNNGRFTEFFYLFELKSLIYDLKSICDKFELLQKEKND